MEYVPVTLHLYLSRQHDYCEAWRRQGASLSVQLWAGMKHIHENEVAHLDIHTNNILIVGQPPDKMALKFSDFGLAQRLPLDQMTQINPEKYDPRARPPELWFADGIQWVFDKPNIRRVMVQPHSCDVWATAVVNLRLLTNKWVHDADSNAVRRHILQHCLNAKSEASPI